MKAAAEAIWTELKSKCWGTKKASSFGALVYFCVLFLLLILFWYSLRVFSTRFIGFSMRAGHDNLTGGNYYLMALPWWSVGPLFRFVCDVPILVDVIKISFASHRKYHTMDTHTSIYKTAREREWGREGDGERCLQRATRGVCAIRCWLLFDCLWSLNVAARFISHLSVQTYA